MQPYYYRSLGRSYSERAAFLWSDAQPLRAQGTWPSSISKAPTAATVASPGQGCGGTNPLAAYAPAAFPAAPHPHNARQLLVDPDTCFQLLSEEDFKRVSGTRIVLCGCVRCCVLGGGTEPGQH